MNILIISSKFPFPLKDGGAIATYRLANGLSLLDNQVFILSFNTKKHFIERSSIPGEPFKNIDYELVEIDTSIKLWETLINLIFSRKPYILQRFKSKNFETALVNLFQKHQFDIVQIEGLYMTQYIKFVKQNSKAIIVYRPHNLEHRIWSLLSENSGNWLKRNYYYSLSGRILEYEKKILNNYDIIIPISPEDATFYEKLGNTRTSTVVPAGFEINKYIQKAPDKLIHKLFFIGSLEWIPNQEGIVWFIRNCWEKLYTRYSGLELHIAGRNTPDWLISQYSNPGIFWAGEVENVEEFIKDKTIMIVPLFSGSGMRIKIIEAFLYSKAVVASGIAVRGTGAADNIELLIADGHIEFISKIGYLINNQNLYHRLLTSGFEYACRYFDNNQISLEVNELFQNQLISKNRNGASDF